MVGKFSYTFFYGKHRYEAGFTLQADLPQQMAYMHGLDRRFCGGTACFRICAVYFGYK
jgi:hypothetical protein